MSLMRLLLVPIDVIFLRPVIGQVMGLSTTLALGMYAKSG